MLSQSNSLGDWISRKWGDQDSLAEKLKVSRATVSAYKTGRINIPPKVQDSLRKLGYEGPWPKEEAQAAPAAGGPYLTEAAFAEWRKYWREGEERVLARLVALEDQVRKLRQQLGSE